MTNSGFSETSRSPTSSEPEAVPSTAHQIELETSDNGYVVYDVEVAGDDGKNHEVKVNAGNGEIRYQDHRAGGVSAVRQVALLGKSLEVASGSHRAPGGDTAPRSGAGSKGQVAEGAVCCGGERRGGVQGAGLVASGN
jgi:hypothetical protein